MNTKNYSHLKETNNMIVGKVMRIYMDDKIVCEVNNNIAGGLTMAIHILEIISQERKQKKFVMKSYKQYSDGYEEEI